MLGKVIKAIRSNLTRSPALTVLENENLVEPTGEGPALKKTRRKKPRLKELPQNEEFTQRERVLPAETELNFGKRKDLLQFLRYQYAIEPRKNVVLNASESARGGNKIEMRCDGCDSFLLRYWRKRSSGGTWKCSPKTDISHYSLDAEGQRVECTSAACVLHASEVAAMGVAEVSNDPGFVISLDVRKKAAMRLHKFVDPDKEPTEKKEGIKKARVVIKADAVVDPFDPTALATSSYTSSSSSLTSAPVTDASLFVTLPHKREVDDAPKPTKGSTARAPKNTKAVVSKPAAVAGSASGAVLKAKKAVSRSSTAEGADGASSGKSTRRMHVTASLPVPVATAVTVNVPPKKTNTSQRSKVVVKVSTDNADTAPAVAVAQGALKAEVSRLPHPAPTRASSAAAPSGPPLVLAAAPKKALKRKKAEADQAEAVAANGACASNNTTAIVDFQPGSNQVYKMPRRERIAASVSASSSVPYANKAQLNAAVSFVSTLAQGAKN